MNTNSKKNDSLLEYFTIIHILCIHENTNNFFLIRFLLNPTPQRTFIFYDIIIIIEKNDLITSSFYRGVSHSSFFFVFLSILLYQGIYLYRRTGTEQQHGTRREKEEEDEGEGRGGGVQR